MVASVGGGALEIEGIPKKAGCKGRGLKDRQVSMAVVEGTIRLSMESVMHTMYNFCKACCSSQ